MQSPRSAFSLIELLVAIAIVVVLVAISVPVISQFRERSQATGCVHQLRNLATAVNLFRTERHQRLWDLRSAADGGEGGVAPAVSLYRYRAIAHGKELRCPSAATVAKGAWLTGGTGAADYMNNIANQPVSYAVNTMSYYINSPWKMPNPITSFMHFNGNEARTPIFMDGIAFSLNVTSWQPSMRLTRMALRHSGRANVLFLDGHVEVVDKEGAMRLDPYGGTNPAWLRDFGPQ